MATGGHDSGDASPLDEMCDDLPTLYERLFPARAKWCNIGLKLKVDLDTLEAIALKHNNPDDCLREILAKRLQAGGPLSWREVCDCLRSPIVDRNNLAEEIEGWRKDIVNTTSKILPIQVPPLPVTGGLNDCSAKQTNQVTSAMTTVGEMSRTEDNSREEKCCDLQEIIDCLESQFSYLTRDAGERLKQEHVPIEEFYRKVSSMTLSLKIVVGKYFKETFESVSSFDVFWGHLNQFWDFFNCELFQHVVRVMFTEADDPLLSKLAEYESELKEFLSKTKLSDFVDHWPFSITKPPKTVIRKLKGVLITVHKKWEDCTLYDIKKTRKKFSEEFMLPPEFMVLVGAGNGSVSILLYVPPSLASSIKEQVKQGKEDFLADNGFLSITIDGVQAYPLPSMEQSSLHGETLKREIKIKEEPTSGQDYQAPLSPLKHIKQETKADPQTTDVKSEEPVSQLLPLGLSTVQHHAIPFDLPGVEVVASTCVIVTNSPQTFHWVGYGFKLTIPQGSLPAGVDQCRLDIKASVAGQYQFPDNLQLVSGVIWIRPYPSGQFQQQLTVEIQHCANMTSSTKLSFVRAHCSQKSLPYTFKQLEGRGSFTEHSSYGCLSVNHFSSFAIAAEGDVDLLYVASLYYLKADPRTVEIHFTIIPNDEVHNAATQHYFQKLGAEEKLNLEVEFEGSNISLDIPISSGVDVNEWRLKPLVKPKISKKRVDSFKPGRAVPSTKLVATLSESSWDCKVPSRSYLTTLKGTKEPDNQIWIVLDPVDPKEETRELLMPPQSHAIHYPPSLGPPHYPVASHSWNMSGIVAHEDDHGCENQLCTRDLQEVFSNLIEVVTNWFNLGLSLGIQVGPLKAIKSNESNHQDRLREMLTHWLQYSPSRTWNDICNGLRSDTVKQINLADKIEEKYKEHSSRPRPLTGDKREATEHTEQVPPKRARSEEQ